MNEYEKKHLRKLGMSKAGIWEIEHHMEVELNKKEK